MLQVYPHIHMAIVLDLDLDFFVWPTVRGPVEGRPPDEEHTCATPDQVRSFLEDQCNLSRDRRVPGCFCRKHDEAFDVWKRWGAEKTLELPFEVAHVDAHSDLSFGDASWSYVLETVLSLPPGERSNPERGYNRLNEGSYLTFAIANRWISRLIFVAPVSRWAKFSRKPPGTVRGLPSDLNVFLFKNSSLRSGAIQLRQINRDLCVKLMSGEPFTPLSIEREVPFSSVPAPEFSVSGITKIVLAHSEEYCPPKSDVLIDVVREYLFDS